MTYNIYVSTDIGKVRKNNEDNFLVNTAMRPLEKEDLNLRGEGVGEPILCSVFDGMGGEASGEVASKICAEEGKELFKLISKSGLLLDESVDMYVTNANNKVTQEIENTLKRRGGSTFVMLYIKDDVASVYSLGDSRAYLYRDGKLVQITKDHTLAMKKYEANIYTLEEALASTDSHKLTSFIGVDMENQGLVSQKYEKITLKENDKILMCSDGLYDMCSDDEILRVLSRNSKTISYDLVEIALENGGVDNITCIVVEVTE